MKQKAFEKLQQLINSLLLQDEQNVRKLKQLHGRITVLVIRPVNLTLNCLFTEQGIEFLQQLYSEPNVTIEGSPLAFLAMNFSSNQLADIFAGKVKVSGDIDTAQKVQALMQGIDLDWEEQIAKITGDPVAYHLGKVVKRSFSFGKRFLGTLQNNLSEYLQEEIRLLPTQVEVDDFLKMVDVLRNDFDRLYARLQLIEQRRQLS